MTHRNPDGTSEPAAYDFEAIQDKWLPVWDELAPFRAGAVGRPAARASTSSTCSRTPPATCTWVTPRRTRWRRRRALLGAAGLQRAAPDRLGLLRPARRERRDQARRRPARVDLREHREAEGVDAPLRVLLRLGPRAAHLRPGVLPLEPVAVPAAVRAGPGLPQGHRWSTGAPTTRPCWPTSRSSAGTASAATRSVTKKKLTQWYFRITDYADRLLDDMDQLEGNWPEKVLSMQRNWIGRSTGADVDFVDRGPRRAGRPSTRRVRTRCSGRRSSWSPPTPTWPPSWRAGTPARGGVRRRTSSRCKASTEIERLSTDRPKTGVFLHRYAVNPVNGERLPICAADYVLADYGTGAIMAVPGARPARPGLRRGVRPAGACASSTAGADDPVATGVRRRRATAVDWSTRARWTGWASAEANRARSSTWLEEQGPGTGAGELPAARLADLAAALLGHADPDRPLPDRAARSPVPDDQLPVALPRRRGARPDAQGHLAAGRGRGLGQRRRARAAAARRSATPTRWTRSSTRRGTSCASSTRTRRPRPFDPPRSNAWLPVDQYIGGVDARDPAPAVRPLLHQGAARHGPGRRSPSRSPRC